MSVTPDEGGAASARRIARNAAVRAAGEVIGKAASLAFFVAMARELGRDGFGDFMFALSLSSVFMIAAGFGTEDLISREVARDRSRVHGYLANVVAVKALLSLVLLLVVALIVNIGDYPSDARAAVYIVGLGVAAENLGRTWHSVFTAFERLEMISISLVIQRTLTAAIGVAILLSGGGLIAVSIVFTAGAFVGLAIATLVLRRFVVTPRWELDRSRWWPLIKTGVPIGFASLLFSVLLRLDAALLGLLTGGGGDNSEVGVYGAAFRLVEATLFITWAFSASVLPWLARRQDPEAVARGYELSAKAITAVLMPIALTFVLLAPQIIHLLYGSGFDDAVTPLRYLGVVTVLFGVNNLAATVLISRDHPKDFNVIVGFTAVENVVANLIFIPTYGADAAAFNAAFSGLLLAVLSVVMIVRRFGHVRPLRIFLSAAAGGAAMAGAVLPISLPLVPAAGLGLLAYLASFAAVERLVYPGDFKRLRETLIGLMRIRRPGVAGT